MATYTYPEMPLRMNVWFRATPPPPFGPPDQEDVPCSCSPISPDQQAGVAIPSQVRRAWTHIIRTASSPSFTDNYMRGDEVELYPITFFEIPAGSGHYYGSIWCHITGAGFANEHARIFAWRWTTGLLADLPWFEGYI
jgi:hypothetical protein